MSKSTCSPTHLDTPLNNALLLESIGQLNDPYSVCRNRMTKNLKMELQELLEKSCTNWKSCHNHPQQDVGWIYRYHQKMTRVNQDRLMELQEDFAGAKFLTSINANKLQHPSITREVMESVFDRVKGSKEYVDLCALYDLRCFFEEAVILSAKPSSVSRSHDLSKWLRWNSLSRCNSTIFHGTFDKVINLWVGPTYGVIKIGGKQSCLTTRNHILMISDLISQRFVLNLSSLVAHQLGKTNYLSHLELSKIYEWGDSLMNFLDNSLIKKIYLWEAMTTSEILVLNNDVYVDCHPFRDSIRQEFLSSDDPVIQARLQVSLMEFDKIIEGFNGNHHKFMQSFGLYRIWGHPTIDGRLSVLNLRSHACSHRPVNYTQAKEIHRSFREDFSTSFYRKHRTWPKFSTLDESKSGYLETCMSRGVELDTTHVDYDISQWDNIKFEKTFEIPEKFELSEMIADKATSHGLNQLRHYIIKDGTIGPSWSRSAIVRHLDENYNNPVEFLLDISANGFGPDEVVAGVHPKEREGNPLARLFGLMTLKKRLYIVLTEALIADNILPYFPEITMTHDSKTLMRKINNLTKPQSQGSAGSKSSVFINVNFDFVKWNLNMRKDETMDLFIDLDDLHGVTGVISRTHEMFETCQFYLADGTYTPKWDSQNNRLVEDDRCWSGHLGGIEGLRQKGWTIWTVVMIKREAKKQKIRCRLMGQGDNQVLVCEYPIHWGQEKIENVHATFLKDLKSSLDRAGPQIKMEETWSSSKFFIYGKYPVYQGSPCSMSMKKLCRTMRLTNEGLQNLESSLSSISANAAAATLSDFDPVTAFFISQLEGLGCLRIHLGHSFFGTPLKNVSLKSFYKVPIEKQPHKIHYDIPSREANNIRNLSSKFLRSILLLPCVLGGYPTSQFCDLLMHGFPDPLSLNIWNLREIYKELRDSESDYKRLIESFLDPSINPNKNPEMLFSDPVSINLLRPSSGSEKVKRMVFDFLTSAQIVKNPVFHQFLQIASESQGDLAKILFTMRPLNPRVGSSMMDATIIGKACKVVGKINKTGTLINLMRNSYDRQNEDMMEEFDHIGLDVMNVKTRVSFTRLYHRFEENFFKCILKFLYDNPGRLQHVSTTCSVSLATSLRERSWGVELQGVTTAVPFEAFSWKKAPTGMCSIDNHDTGSEGFFLLRSAHKERKEMRGCLEWASCGPFTPFFGSKTRSKVIQEHESMKKVCPGIVRATGHLIGLIGWATEEDSNLSKLIKSIHYSITDIPSDCFKSVVTSSLGALSHRWDDEKTSHEGSISVLYSAMTWVNCITNYYRPENSYIGATTDNFNISYQSVFSSVYSLYSIWCSLGDGSMFSASYHGHSSGCPCIREVNEAVIDIDSSPDDWKDIAVLKSHPENPYCWVSRETIITDRIASLYGSIKYPTTIDPELINQVKLSYLTCSWIFERNPITPLGVICEEDLEETHTIIPVNVAKVIDTSQLLSAVVILRLIQHFYINSTARSKSTSYSREMWLSEAVMCLGRTPLKWYLPLHSVLLNDTAVMTLVMENPGLIPPLGTPPTPQEKSVFLHSAVINSSTRMGSPSQFLEHMTGLLDNLVYSKSILLHPVLIYVVTKIFSSSSEESSLKWVRRLALLRSQMSKIKQEIEVTSDVNIMSYLGHPEGLTERDYSDILGMITDVDRYYLRNPPIIWKGVPESAAKGMPPITITTVEHLEDPLNSDVLLELPLTSKSLFKSSVLPELSACVVLTRAEFEPITRSYANHFLKTETIITGSSYKMLSLLAFLKRKGAFFDVRTALVAADGVGGTSVLLKRLFPASRIVYNSLFEVSNLSSIGIDKFSPACITLHRSAGGEEIEGIETAVNASSDLTRRETMTVLHQICPSYDWIVCDAEGHDWNSPHKQLEIAKNLSDLAHKSDTKLMILKSYAEKLDFSYLQFVYLTTRWSRVELLRTIFSSVGNTEIYYCCSEKKKLVEGEEFKWDYDFSEKECIILSKHFNLLQYRAFIHSIVEEDDFYGVCSTSVRCLNKYVESPVIQRWRYKRLMELQSRYTSVDPMRVPINSIYELRKIMNPVAITQSFRSHIKPSDLNSACLREIVLQSFKFMGVLIGKDIAILKKVEAFLETGTLTIYQTIDRSWAWVFNGRKRDFEDVRHATFWTRKFCTKPFISKMVKEMGLYSSLPQDSALFYYSWSKNFESCFAFNQKDWWEHKSKLYYPPNLTPLKEIDGMVITVRLPRPRLRHAHSASLSLANMEIPESTRIEFSDMDSDEELEEPEVSRLGPRRVKHNLPIILDNQRLKISSLVHKFLSNPETPDQSNQ